MRKITLLFSVLLIFAYGSVKAQTAVSADKQKAIKELTALLTQDSKTEDFIRAFSAQIDSVSEEVVKASLSERKDLTVAERQSMHKTLIEDSQRYKRQLEDKLLKKLDFNALTDEITAIVYDKYYSLEEIRDLITFYKTPTGQKTLKVIQPIMLESMQLSQERLVPKVLAAMDELRQEQKQIVARRINELKPRKKKQGFRS